MAYSSDDKHFDKVAELVGWSYIEQRADRQIHRSLVWHLGGEYYPTTDGEVGMDTPINLLSLASRAMARSLIAKAPRGLAVTDSQALKSFAEAAEISLNQRIVRSNLAETLREVAGQSMVSVGIFFLGAEYEGVNDGMRLKLLMESIDRCDYVYDIQSRTLEDADLQGNRFRMPLKDVREHPWFDREAAAEVQGSMTAPYSEEDENDLRRARRRSRGDLYDYVDIWRVYERRRNKLWYFPCQQPTLKLAEMDWTGPSHGPYRYLYYEKLPNHAIPVSPLMHLLKKHRAFNILDAKTIHQQQTAKGNLFYTNASRADAERIVNSFDNQSVLQENGAVRWGHIGGAAPDTVAMAEKQRRDFSYAAGGLDTYAGLSGQSAETLGESRLLAGAANAMLEDMGGYAQEFMKGVLGDVYWFDIRDPDPNTRMLRKPIEGTNVTYGVPWTPEKRAMIERFQFDIDVEPYSYRMRSPEGRLADLLSAVQVVLSMGPMAAAQGVMVNVPEVVRQIARLRNLPELNDALITNRDPNELTAMMQAGGGGQQPQGTSGPKRYIRESRSSGAGEQQEILRSMGRSQAAEMVAA